MNNDTRYASYKSSGPIGHRTTPFFPTEAQVEKWASRNGGRKGERLSLSSNWRQVIAATDYTDSRIPAGL